MKNHKLICLAFIIIAILAYIQLTRDVSYYVTPVYFMKNVSSSVEITHKVPAIDKNPWGHVPDYVLYLRLTSTKRFVQEYENFFLWTMKMFFPQDKAKLLLVLDNEKKKDHAFGEKISRQWPYPQLCYAEPMPSDVYHKWGKSRMFLDMMYPDQCTNAAYVGYVDTDTFFMTIVTPQLLFNEQGKPIIVGKIGKLAIDCWAQSTTIFLGKKEVLQCMSTFPLMVKTAHMREMRGVLSKQHDKPFHIVFRDSAAKGRAYCVCQFSIICNYLWYHHHNEYEWRLQMVPDGNWRGEKLSPYQVPLSYYEAEVKQEMQIPIPRSSIHLRYTITNGTLYDKSIPPKKLVHDFIKEGLCYSFGFEACPDHCRKWNQTKLHYNLFSFEYYQWLWDPRCKDEQIRHYTNVKKLINYYNITGQEMLFNRSMERICDMI